MNSAVIEGNKSGSIPSDISMGHELGHAWDLLNSGSNTANFIQIANLTQGISNSEQNAMFWENVLRAAAGLPLRTMYNYDVSKGAELPALMNVKNVASLPLMNGTLQNVTLSSLNGTVIYKFLRIK